MPVSKQFIIFAPSFRILIITDPECCPNFFPDYREHLGYGRDVRWTNRIYPDGTWETNLYQFYSRVLPLLEHALPVPFHLDENGHRKDTTTAHTSLREAFGNCLIHCAYTVMGNIVIDRYDDRIVMSNPGTMLVSMEEFWEGGYSVCRNPLLQKMFVFVGVGEKAGSGANIICAGWRDNGWLMPTLVEHQTPNRVETTLFVADIIEQQKDIAAEESGLNSGMKTDNDAESGMKSGMKTENDAKSGMKSGMKSEDDAKSGLKTTQEQILLQIKHNPYISIAAIAKELEMAKSGIAKQMQQLQASGIIKRIGPDKGGHWEIVNESKAKYD